MSVVGETLEGQLRRHEGVRYLPYKDSLGILTIGVGHNLSKPLSDRAVQVILEDDINEAREALYSYEPWVLNLDSARRNVLINMSFNMGMEHLEEFKQTLTHIKNGQYGDAADHMLSTLWAKQVGPRAVELATIMRNGG